MMQSSLSVWALDLLLERDVDVVIETMRGHSLGRCIYDGPAQPNTGIPGNVGGYTHGRVIHSPKAGLFTAKRHIGEFCTS